MWPLYELIWCAAVGNGVVPAETPYDIIPAQTDEGGVLVFSIISHH